MPNNGSNLINATRASTHQINRRVYVINLLDVANRPLVGVVKPSTRTIARYAPGQVTQRSRHGSIAVVLYAPVDVNQHPASAVPRSTHPDGPRPHERNGDIWMTPAGCSVATFRSLVLASFQTPAARGLCPVWRWDAPVSSRSAGELVAAEALRSASLPGRRHRRCRLWRQLGRLAPRGIQRLASDLPAGAVLAPHDSSGVTDVREAEQSAQRDQSR